MEENPRFLPIVSTHRILFHFLILFHDFEGRKMKQNAVGTVLYAYMPIYYIIYIICLYIPICQLYLYANYIPIMLLLFCVGLGQNYSKLSKNQEANLDGKSRGGSLGQKRLSANLTQESRENLRSFREKFFSLFSALSRTE